MYTFFYLFFVDVIRFNYLFNAFFMNWFQDYGRWEYYIPIQFLKQLFDCWACFLRISLLVEVVFGFMGLRFLYLTNFICVPPIAISSSTDSGTVVVTCCACLYLLWATVSYRLRNNSFRACFDFVVCFYFSHSSPNLLIM